MSLSDYKDWNSIFVEEYLKNSNHDINQEITIFADKELIIELGKKNKKIAEKCDSDEKIIDSFLNCYPRNIEQKKQLFLYITKSEIPKLIANWNLFELFENMIPNEPKHQDYLAQYNEKLEKLFNFLVLALYVRTERNDDEDRSYYERLNRILGSSHRRIQQLNNLDVYFDRLEKYFSLKGLTFNNRKEGNIRYMAKLKPHTFLSFKERKEIDSIIVSNHRFQSIEDENEILRLLISKSKGTLMQKIALCYDPENGAYLDWLVHRVKTPRISTGYKSKKEKREIRRAFIREGEFYILGWLIQDLYDEVPTMELDGQQLTLNSNWGTVDGFYADPLRTGDEIYPASLDQNELSIEGVELDVLTAANPIIFQEKARGIYVHSEIINVDLPTILFVKKDKAILAWLNEKSSDLGINKLEDSLFKFKSDVTEWSPYYFSSGFEDIPGFISPTFSIDRKENVNSKKIIPVGGIKDKDQQLYLSFALPRFKLKNFSKEEFDELEIKVFARGEEIGIKIDKSHNSDYNEFSINLNFDEEEHQELFNQTNGILRLTIKFQDYKGIIKERTILVKNEILDRPMVERFKLDRWGFCAELNSAEHYDGVKLTTLNHEILKTLGSKHSLNDLADFCIDRNTFIHRLTSSIISRGKQEFDYKYLNDSILMVLESIEIDLRVSDKAVKRNIVDNLLAMRVLNVCRSKEEGTSVYQLNDVSLSLIPKSFDNLTQVFKVNGARTRYFEKKLFDFCLKRNIQIKQTYSENINDQFTKILGGNIFIHQSFIKFFDEFKEYLVENKLNTQIEIEDKYILGSSLLKYSASVIDYEQNFNVELNLLEDGMLKESNDPQFPRRREELRTRYGIQKSYIEVEKGKFSPYFGGWSWIFLKYKRKEKILMQQRETNGNLRSEIYINKYQNLPLVIKIGLLDLNQGIPSLETFFISNKSWSKYSGTYLFDVFERYNLTNDKEIRKGILQTMTGNENHLINDCVFVFDKIDGMKILRYDYCYSRDRIGFDQLLLLKQNDKILAIITLCQLEKLGEVRGYKPIQYFISDSLIKTSDPCDYLDFELPAVKNKINDPEKFNVTGKFIEIETKKSSGEIFKPYDFLNCIINSEHKDFLSRKETKNSNGYFMVNSDLFILNPSITQINVIKGI